MARKDNLSTPRGAPVRSGYDADAFARWAESVARLFGTGRYLVAQTVFVIAWIGFNVVAWSLQWDPYPFVFLNLMFSTQAAYAAPLILLAHNRQADRDKEEVERDRETNARALAETEFLARELAAVRLSLEAKADRDDLVAPIERLTRALGQITGVSLGEEPEGYSADSSHQ